MRPRSLSLSLALARGLTDSGRRCSPLDIHDLSFDDDDAQIDLADAPTTSPSAPSVPGSSPAPDAPYTFRRPTPYSATLRYGGSGLKGSAPSYLRILRALLRGGALDDSTSTSCTSSRILKPETVDLMFTPQLTAAQRETYQRDQWAGGEPFSRKAGKALEDADWGLGGALTGTGLTSGRSARSLHWSGMAVRPLPSLSTRLVRRWLLLLLLDVH